MPSYFLSLLFFSGASLCNSFGHLFIETFLDENFIGEEREGVDYGKLASLIPQIRANIEFIDKTIVSTLLPGIFGTLKKGPDMKTLSITKSEKRNLIEQIDSSFGQKLNAKQKNYHVVAASILKNALIEFKSADE